MKIITYLILSFLVMLLGYITFRIFVRNDYKREGKLSGFSTTLEFLIFAGHANLSYVFLPVKWPGIPSFPENQFQVAFGLLLMLVGLVLTLSAMSGLGFQKAFGRDQVGLNREGFYQYTRNPQIVAYALIVIGLATMWFSLYAVGWVVVYFLIAHMMVRTEEEHLLRLFTNDYERYCRDVPRYISILRRKK
jgi:protein-S-isoprenylcysteine O-methyltransferase Ste14